MDSDRNMIRSTTVEHMVNSNSARIAVKYTTMYLFNYYNDIKLMLTSLRHQTLCEQKASLSPSDKKSGEEHY